MTGTSPSSAASARHGERIRYWAAENALQSLAEVGPRLELTYPPDSGVWRAKDYGHGELVKGVHVGLTKAETTRRVTLSERGAAEYKALCERQRDATDPPSGGSTRGNSVSDTLAGR